jgi:hypothetical protein
MSQTNDTCREAFKTLANERSLSLKREKDGYFYGNTNSAWRVWQAAWQARQPLTDEQIVLCLEAADWPTSMIAEPILAKLEQFARAIERAHEICEPDKKDIP